jgi:mRNA interferase MazF
MNRGEIWWAQLNSPAGRRPVVLLSRDEAYLFRSLVVIAPVTSRIRHISSEVMLTPEDGMPQECAINLDTITTIDKDSLTKRITVLKPEKMNELEAAIHFALGLIK